MSKSKLPNSIRKYIRLTKAKIRREILEPKKQEELIIALITKFIKPSAPIQAEAVVEGIVIEKPIKKNKEKHLAEPTKRENKAKHGKSKKQVKK